MSEEPIAWASIPDKINGHSFLKLGSENHNPQNYTVPLYTKEQLHPKVNILLNQFLVLLKLASQIFFKKRTSKSTALIVSVLMTSAMIFMSF